MKTILVIISATLLLTTSCTKESFLDLEVDTSLRAPTEHSQPKAILLDDEIERESYLEEGDTTIQLQKISSTISSATNEYIVHYYRSYDFTEAQLAETQTLDFTNPQGSPVTLTFWVNSYTDSTSYFEVAYALGSRDLTGWELKEMQQIVVQDVIVN